MFVDWIGKICCLLDNEVGGVGTVLVDDDAGDGAGDGCSRMLVVVGVLTMELVLVVMIGVGGVNVCWRAVGELV